MLYKQFAYDFIATSVNASKEIDVSHFKCRCTTLTSLHVSVSSLIKYNTLRYANILVLTRHRFYGLV